MTDSGSEPQPTPEPFFSPPDPGLAQPVPQHGPSWAPDTGQPQPVPEQRALSFRNPYVRLVSAVVAIVAGVGIYVLAHNLWTGRNDNRPVSTSAQTRSGGITVTGHGITMSFPSGWINVPMTPDGFANFLRTSLSKLPHIKSALQSEISNPQQLRRLAMLVYDVKPDGTQAANLDAIVEPGTLPPGQMIEQLKAANGPQQFGATDVQYSTTTYGQYQAALITYTLQARGITLHGAQAYLSGPGETAIVTVTSPAVATSTAKLRQIIVTIKFN